MRKASVREFWTKVVEEFEGNDGGETHEEFARRRGVEKTTFEPSSGAKETAARFCGAVARGARGGVHGTRTRGAGKRR